MKDAMVEEGEAEDCNFIRTVTKAAYSVKHHPVRICDAPTLTAVKGIGPTLTKARSLGGPGDQGPGLRATGSQPALTTAQCVFGKICQA